MRRKKDAEIVWGRDWVFQWEHAHPFLPVRFSGMRKSSPIQPPLTQKGEDRHREMSLS